jgi:AraC family transcriptional regulator
VRRRGEFWGRTSGTVELLSCEVRQLQATAPENEVPHHGHEAAHFVFVPGGEYISSAEGAPEVSRLPLLVFNPAGTEHRDRFLNGRGGFMTITLSSQVETPGGGAVALNAFDSLRVARLLALEVGRPGETSIVAEAALAGLLGAVQPPEPINADPPGWLRRAYEMIWTSDDPGLGVGDVATAVGVHPVHLARVFGDHLGCSPGEALRGRRLERAAALLGRSLAGLAETAVVSGFADQSHMTRAFSQAYSVTPAAFRRSRHVANLQDGRPGPA